MRAFSKILLAATLIGAVGFVALADRNIPSNELPNEAKTFINKHYNGVTIYDCEIDGMKYDVELGNGVDLEFDNSGKLRKIDADDNTLAQSVVKALLPAKAFEYLTNQGLTDKVEEIEFRRNTIVVDIDNYGDRKIKFSLDGNVKKRN